MSIKWAEFYKSNIDNIDYLGEAIDNTGRPVIGYKYNNNIYLVYSADESIESIAHKNIEDIKSNQNKYVWTPYIEFI